MGKKSIRPNFYIFNAETLEFETKTGEITRSVNGLKKRITLFFILMSLAMIGLIHLAERNTALKYQLEDQKQANIRLNKRLREVIKMKGAVRVVATCYTAEESQTDDSPLVTADNSLIDTSRIDSMKWIAVSRDLERVGIEMGDRVLIEGTGRYDGIWTVHDRMNKKYNQRIDFLISKKENADLFKEVKIRKIN